MHEAFTPCVYLVIFINPAYYYSTWVCYQLRAIRILWRANPYYWAMWCRCDIIESNHCTHNLIEQWHNTQFVGIRLLVTCFCSGRFTRQLWLRELFIVTCCKHHIQWLSWESVNVSPFHFQCVPVLITCCSHDLEATDISTYYYWWGVWQYLVCCSCTTPSFLPNGIQDDCYCTESVYS